MYHYKESGLSNVFLKNGYEVKETAYGKTVSIKNIDGLHKALALSIVEDSKKMSGEEFRFLRKELNLSQRSIGAMLGKTDQSVAKWEKDNIVPTAGDRIMRQLYLEFIGKNSRLTDLLDKLSELDSFSVSDDSRNLQLDEDDWSPIAA